MQRTFTSFSFRQARRIPISTAPPRWLVTSRALHQAGNPINRSLISPCRLPPKKPWPSSTFIRHNTELTDPSAPSPSKQPESASPTATQPAYKLYFTCKPCLHRSGPHRISKQGYHKGTTLITCPSCKSRHVVSDHLKIFMKKGCDLEEIMAMHGEKLKKGKLGIRPGETVGYEDEEEIEFWEDGTQTPHGQGGSQSKGQQG